MVGDGNRDSPPGKCRIHGGGQNPCAKKVPNFGWFIGSLFGIQFSQFNRIADIYNIHEIDPFNGLSVSDIKFSDVRKNARGGKAVYLNHKAGGKIMLKFPALRAPFGLSTFTDEGTGKVTSTSMPLSIDNPAVAAKLDEINKIVLDFVADHCEDLMGKKMSRESLADQYKSPFKPSTKEGYSPILNLKVLMKDGAIATEAYSASRQPTALTDLEKGQAVNAIIDINQIWRTPAGVGITIRVHQVMFAPTSKLKPCAFLASADEPVVETEGSVEYETDPDQ